MARNRFRKSVFRNGLTIISERCPGMRGISLGVWVKAGSRYELPNEAGLSHFLEHMLFKGTQTRNALTIAREIEGLGGDFNASTDREYTCFQVLLKKSHLSIGATILADIVLNSQFDADELERERKVILQEIAMVEDSPEELVFDLFFEKIYGRHGLGRMILGSEASMKRHQRRDLLRYFRKYYRPERVVVAAVGDVAHTAVVREFRQLSRTQWPGRTPQSPAKLGFDSAKRIRDGIWWMERPTEQSHFLWGVQAGRFDSRDRFATLLLSIYLGGGMCSRLFQEVRERHGLAYNVYSLYFPFMDSGLFTVYLGTSPNKIIQSLDVIEEVLIDVQRKGITEADLEIAKNVLKGTIHLSSDDVESWMSTIAKNEIFFGQNTTVDEFSERIDAVKATDLKRVARRLFAPARRSVFLLGPAPAKRRAFFSKLRNRLNPRPPK